MKAPNEVANLPILKISDIRPFGCRAWYKVPEAERTKLSPKAREAVLLSFLSHGNGFVLWDLGKQKVVRSRDVIFDEDNFPYQAYHTSSNPTALTPPPEFPVNATPVVSTPSSSACQVVLRGVSSFGYPA